MRGRSRRDPVRRVGCTQFKASSMVGCEFVRARNTQIFVTGLEIPMDYSRDLLLPGPLGPQLPPPAVLLGLSRIRIFGTLQPEPHPINAQLLARKSLTWDAQEMLTIRKDVDIHWFLVE